VVLRELGNVAISPRFALFLLLPLCWGCSLLPPPPDGGGAPNAAPTTAAPLGGNGDRLFLEGSRFLSGRYDFRAYQLAPALLQLDVARSGVWALDRVSLARGVIAPPVPREGLIAFGRGEQEDQFPAGFSPAEGSFLVDLGSFVRALHEQRGLNLPTGRYTVVVEGRFTPLAAWPPEPRQLTAGDRFEVTLAIDL